MKLIFTENSLEDYQKIFDNTIGLSNLNNGVLARQLISLPSSPLIRQKVAKEIEVFKAKEDCSLLDLEDLAYTLSSARPAGHGNYVFTLKIYAKKRPAP